MDNTKTTPQPKKKRKAPLALAAVVLCILALPAGAWLWFNVVEGEAPDKVSDLSTESAAPAAGGSIDGTWKIAEDGTVVGYRVQEQAFGQTQEAYGRTSDVTGSMVIDGTIVKTATFEADMATVASDQQRRDNQFKSRIMAVDQFPKATFVLEEPITIEGTDTASATVKGKLTLRGTTKTVSVPVQGRRNGDKVEVAGSIPIVFEEWKIPNPDFAPAVNTEDSGILEFKLVFAKT